MRWGLFSLLFLLACFGFFGFFCLFVALRLAFSQGFSGIEPESRGENRRTTVGSAPTSNRRGGGAQRRREALDARCLHALPVPLAVVRALLGASSPSPLAVFAAIFALLFRSPCLRLSLRTRFPFHDSQVLFSMKSRSKILPGRPWKFQDFFFRPRRVPGALRKRFGSHF